MLNRSIVTGGALSLGAAALALGIATSSPYHPAAVKDDVALVDIVSDETTIDADLIGVAGSLDQGAFLDTMATEDTLNHLLGVSSTASETAVLSDWTTLFPNATLPTGDTLPAVGAPGFDADLFSIANGEFTTAGTDFTSGLSSLPGDVTGLLPSLGTDLTSVLSGGGLTDLTNLLPDLLSGLGL